LANSLPAANSGLIVFTTMLVTHDSTFAAPSVLARLDLLDDNGN
jgi:hypothetical protein